MKKILQLASFIAALGIGPRMVDPSAAAEPSLLVCAKALETKCGGVKLGANHALSCFERHLSQASPSCSAKLARIASQASACQADVKRLCMSDVRVSEVYACMKGRLAEISRPCRGALARIALQMRRHG